MSAHNSLSKNEAQVLKSIRLFQANLDYRPGDPGSEKKLVTLHKVIGKLIDLVRKCDPFIVNLNNLNDYTLSLFELQVLYAIATFRCGRKEITTEILNWWLPIDESKQAFRLIRTIAVVLDEIEIEIPSADRLAACILEITGSRLRSSQLRVIEGGLPTNFKKTLH